MTELPDYHKITFSGFLPVPFENIVPDATTEVGIKCDKIPIFF